MHTVVTIVNGRAIYVETSGDESGPAVVLLHHGLGSVRAWREQIPALAGIGFRVIAYDRWGYGRSDFRRGLGIPDFDDDLADLEALLSVFNPEHLVLVGHSDGGTIALRYAARHPETVAALVTVAAHVYVEAKMAPSADAVRAAFENDARFRAALQRVHGEKAATVFDNWYSGWSRPENLAWDLRPALRGIACPTLVVQGAEDEHATPQHAADIAASLASSRLWIVPGAWHMLPQDQPAAFNAGLTAFLQPLFAARLTTRIS